MFNGITSLMMIVHTGQCCSIPFKYKQVTYNSCTTAYYNRPWWSLRPCQGGGGVSHVALNFKKRLLSVFINASRRCRKLNENALSLSEF